MVEDPELQAAAGFLTVPEPPQRKNDPVSELQESRASASNEKSSKKRKGEKGESSGNDMSSIREKHAAGQSSERYDAACLMNGVDPVSISQRSSKSRDR